MGCQLCKTSQARIEAWNWELYLGSGDWKLELEFVIQNPEYGIRDPESGLYPGSGMGDQGGGASAVAELVRVRARAPVCAPQAGCTRSVLRNWRARARARPCARHRPGARARFCGRGLGSGNPGIRNPGIRESRSQKCTILVDVDQNWGCDACGE